MDLWNSLKWNNLGQYAGNDISLFENNIMKVIKKPP
tara:strand:- start:17009 stop:17116 length:108 start_codon:yes stop_codon:yes gene_type:complete